MITLGPALAAWEDNAIRDLDGSPDRGKPLRGGPKDPSYLPYSTLSANYVR